MIKCYLSFHLALLEDIRGISLALAARILAVIAGRGLFVAHHDGLARPSRLIPKATKGGQAGPDEKGGV